MIVNNLIKSSSNLLLILSVLSAVSCGQRQRQVAPTKVSKPKTETPVPVDNSANLVVQKKICVRENCPASNFTIILSGPMSSKVNGFIAEVAIPVNWQIQIWDWATNNWFYSSKFVFRRKSGRSATSL